MYRLIWFQHVHKAAGSSIINQAVANGEVLFPSHQNGNPCNEGGEVMPLWDFDEGELRGFVDECQTKEVTFVATEWGAPNFGTLHDDPRVLLMTCIREPWSRLVSNFNYDHYLGFSNSTTLAEYLVEDRRIMMDNLLVRIFANRFLAERGSIGEDSLSNALSNLSLFDLVIVIERDGDLSDHLFGALDWEKMKVDSHSTFGNRWTLSRLVRKFRLASAIRYILKMKIEVSEDDHHLFEDQSRIDLEFYGRIMEGGIRGRLHPLNMNPENISNRSGSIHLRDR